MGAGRGGNVVNGLIWLIILIFVSWFVACFCFPFYVLFSVLGACIDGLKGVSDILIKGVQFPATCAENMVACKSLG